MRTIVVAGDMQTVAAWLNVPADAFWVNLNPGERHRIIDDRLAQTTIGRCLLVRKRAAACSNAVRVQWGWNGTERRLAVEERELLAPRSEHRSRKAVLGACV